LASREGLEPRMSEPKSDALPTWRIPNKKLGIPGPNRTANL